MASRKRFRCKNCGERFEVEVLTEEEVRERARRNEGTSPVCCPKCFRIDVRGGWD